MKTRLLFVCTSNIQRSPTAEDLYKRYEQYETRSCGVDFAAVVRASNELIEWADVIVCMEEFHKDSLLESFPAASKKIILVLDIPDEYLRNDPHLVLLLKSKLDPLLA